MNEKSNAWLLVDEFGETVLSGPTPESLIEEMAERCRAGAGCLNVPQMWKHIRRWGWRMMLVANGHRVKVKFKPAQG